MNILPTLEAAYAVEDEGAWLARLALALEPLLGDSGAVLFWNHKSEFIPRGFAAHPKTQFLPLLWACTERSLKLPKAKLLFDHPAGSAFGLTELVDLLGQGWLTHAETERELAAVGLIELAFAGWVDPGGFRFAIWSGVSKTRPVLSPELVAKVGVHLLAGLRLTQKKLPAPSAWLTSDGRLVDATGSATTQEARDALRSAAKNIDRARSYHARQTEEERLDLWTGLVMGEWSLVDRFESDGRHLMIAYENSPEAADLRALSRQEAQIAAYLSLGYSQKIIAYCLGISMATVSAHVTRLRQKLGVDSRVDLTAFLASVLHEAARS